MKPARRIKAGTGTGILILSAIDLLLAALTAAFGFMLILSDAVAESGAGAGAGQGNVASQTIVEITHPTWLAISCDKRKPEASELASVVNGENTISDTYQFAGSQQRLHCNTVSLTGKALVLAQIFLPDGTPLLLTLQCAAGSTELLHIDLRPGIPAPEQRFLGGSCSHRFGGTGVGR